MAAFDIYILKRPGAEQEYTDDTIREAEIRFSKMSGKQKKKLTDNILAGLPGSEEGYTLKEFQSILEFEKKSVEEFAHRPDDE